MFFLSHTNLQLKKFKDSIVLCIKLRGKKKNNKKSSHQSFGQASIGLIMYYNAVRSVISELHGRTFILPSISLTK